MKTASHVTFVTHITLLSASSILFPFVFFVSCSGTTSFRGTPTPYRQSESPDVKTNIGTKSETNSETGVEATTQNKVEMSAFSEKTWNKFEFESGSQCLYPDNKFVSNPKMMKCVQNKWKEMPVVEEMKDILSAVPGFENGAAQTQEQAFAYSRNIQNAVVKLANQMLSAAFWIEAVNRNEEGMKRVILFANGKTSIDDIAVLESAFELLTTKKIVRDICNSCAISGLNSNLDSNSNSNSNSEWKHLNEIKDCTAVAESETDSGKVSTLRQRACKAQVYYSSCVDLFSRFKADATSKISAAKNAQYSVETIAALQQSLDRVNSFLSTN